MAKLTLQVNGQRQTVVADPSVPLLWILREYLGLKGTKYGCGRGLCGACTVHLDGSATRSCILPISQANGHEIRTIEGLASDGMHPLQEAWIEENVPQCGYCQAGQIMQAAELLSEVRDPSDEEIDRAMAGVACRCGTYQRIRCAIHRAARMARGDSE